MTQSLSIASPLISPMPAAMAEPALQPLQLAIHKMAAFVANQGLEPHGTSLTTAVQEQKLMAMQQQLQQHIEALQSQLTHLQANLSLAGLNQWQQELEKTFAQGQAQLTQLAHYSQQARNTVETIQQQVQGAAQQLFKKLKGLKNNLQSGELKKLAQDNLRRTQHTCHSALTQLHHANHRARYSGLILAFLVMILVNIITSIYLDGRLPWEIHHEILFQRQMGLALNNTWDNLSGTDRAKIIQDASVH